MLGFRGKCVHDPNRMYTISKECRVSHKHKVHDEQAGHVSVKKLLESKHGGKQFQASRGILGRLNRPWSSSEITMLKAKFIASGL